MTAEPKQVFLKQNVRAEPLCDQWYAWSHLISPATAAMHVAHSHLKIARSFIAAPQVHVSALKNPAMAGGPFINYAESRVGEIRALVERTEKDRAHVLELAEAVKSLNELLASEATGFSLEPLYDKVPDALKGFVELVYDTENHASVRFLEGLLYRSRFYNESSQRIALSPITGDHRPFVFSTPRLRDNETVLVNASFSDEGLDELFRMKCSPRPYGYIKDVLGIEETDDDLFASLFTSDRQQACSRFEGPGVRVRYFGHACLLVESEGVSVLTDPVISYKYDSPVPRYTFADLPDRIDHVLITHNHQDHCMLETLIQLRHKIRNVIVPKNNGGSLADPSLKLMLKRIGFKNVTEIDEMENIEIERGGITAIPFLGEHGDLNIRSKTAYLIAVKGRSLLCMADSNNIDPKLYEHVRELIPPVDMMFLGMECDGAPLSWVYAPLMTRPLPRSMDQSRRLDGSNYEKSRRIVDALNPGQVYIYAMGQEPWLTYVTSISYSEKSRPITESNKLIEHCRGRGIESDRLFGQREFIL
ncbi:MAG TPA: MBL fold metallo-hydrolase [Blastocatellia bacterium]|jgi:L-ascorbate metabolism protein UlaG (beta-lactamase superfamily)|nr:MBL fold metallo-hydrolase [Blastocatellia bacterium]